MPRACIFAMFSFAGFEKPHSSMLQVATESLQPHWQARREPTRRASMLGFSDAVWAQVRAAIRVSAASHSTRGSVVRAPAKARRPAPRSKALSLNRGMLSCYSNYFGAGVLHLDLARDQAGEGAADQH